MAAVFMNKLPCDCFLHDLLDLWDMETQQRPTESAECIQHDELKQTLFYSLFDALWMLPWLVNRSYEYILFHKYSHLAPSNTQSWKKPSAINTRKERVYTRWVGRMQTVIHVPWLLRGKGEIESWHAWFMHKALPRRDCRWWNRLNETAVFIMSSIDCTAHTCTCMCMYIQRNTHSTDNPEILWLWVR